MTRLIPFSTKLARFREQRNVPMSKSYRHAVAKKLKEQIDQATDPKVIADLANVLAKYLPKPKQSRRRRGIQPPIEATKERTLDDVVTEMEKKCKAIKLAEASEHAAVNGASEGVA
jgi:hypothetical protein